MTAKKSSKKKSSKKKFHFKIWTRNRSGIVYKTVTISANGAAAAKKAFNDQGWRGRGWMGNTMLTDKEHIQNERARLMPKLVAAKKARLAKKKSSGNTSKKKTTQKPKVRKIRGKK